MYWTAGQRIDPSRDTIFVSRTTIMAAAEKPRVAHRPYYYVRQGADSAVNAGCLSVYIRLSITVKTLTINESRARNSIFTHTPDLNRPTLLPPT